MNELEVIKFLIEKAPNWAGAIVAVSLLWMNLRKTFSIHREIGEAAFLRRVVEWQGERLKILELEMSHRQREINACHARLDIYTKNIGMEVSDDV